MKITVKLFAGLRQFLPEDARGESLVMRVADETTPYQILARLNVPEAKIHLVLINGIYIEPEQRAMPILKEHDVLAVWPAVAGG